MQLGKRVVKHRKAILVISLLLLIPSVFGIAGTRINYDMLYYLPDSMETVQGEDLLMKDFGTGGFTIVVTENMKTDKLAQMREDFLKVPHVSDVINLQEVINPSVPIEMYPEAVQDAIKNEDASMLVVFFDTSTSEEASLDAVEQLREIGDKDTYVSGMTALVLDLKNLCEEEEPKYIAVAVILSLLAMMVLLDSYLVPCLFLASIGMAIIYNLGSNIVFGEISYITKAIAAVLQLGVTLDYSIFLWHRYNEHEDETHDPFKSMEMAIDEALVSVTGSSITTIAGFLALCFMSYTMGKDLGIVMAKGVLFGVICSVTVLPVLILAFRKWLDKTRHKSLIPDMTRLANGLTKRYGIYIAIFAILIFPAVYGYNHDNISYDFTNLAQAGDTEDALGQLEFKTANEKLSEDFGIATSYIVIGDSNMSTYDGYRMSEELKDVDGVTSVLGLDAMLGPALPRSMLPDELKDALVQNGHQMIMINGAYKVSTDECNDQIEEVNEIVAKYDKTASVIGEGPATKDLIELTSKDFTIVNFISILMVFLIIFFVLRSVSLPFILIVTIELAIYINLGISGFTGLEMPFIVPVCISTIQLGSTVDYAILMSTRYKEERMKGLERKEAVTTAAANSIPSILVSALGFFTATIGVSIYSNISIISTFCVLMARGAIISMIVCICLLPALLMAFDGVICKTTLGLRKRGNKA